MSICLMVSFWASSPLSFAFVTLLFYRYLYFVVNQIKSPKITKKKNCIKLNSFPTTKKVPLQGFIKVKFEYFEYSIFIFTEKKFFFSGKKYH